MRDSRPVLGERGGEIPPRHSTAAGVTSKFLEMADILALIKEPEGVQDAARHIVIRRWTRILFQTFLCGAAASLIALVVGLATGDIVKPLYLVSVVTFPFLPVAAVALLGFPIALVMEWLGRCLISRNP